jgi:hypothetical protein
MRGGFIDNHEGLKAKHEQIVSDQFFFVQSCMRKLCDETLLREDWSVHNYNMRVFLGMHGFLRFA